MKNKIFLFAIGIFFISLISANGLILTETSINLNKTYEVDTTFTVNITNSEPFKFYNITIEETIATVEKFGFGIHTTQKQVDADWNACVDDTVSFVIDNLRMTHGSTDVVGVDSDFPEVASQFQLSQNYPNPFNPTTTFSYVVPRSSEVAIAIYNIRGELVRTLESGYQNVGRHQVIWNGLDDSGEIMSSGIYIYSLTSASQTISKQMLFLK